MGHSNKKECGKLLFNYDDKQRIIEVYCSRCKTFHYYHVEKMEKVDKTLKERMKLKLMVG